MRIGGRKSCHSIERTVVAAFLLLHEFANDYESRTSAAFCCLVLHGAARASNLGYVVFNAFIISGQRLRGYTVTVQFQPLIYCNGITSDKALTCH